MQLIELVNVDPEKNVIRCQAVCSCGATSGTYEGPRADLEVWLARASWMISKGEARCSLNCALQRSGAYIPGVTT